MWHCSVHQYIAATTFLDVVQVIQPQGNLHTRACSWPCTDLSGPGCSQFISSGGFSRTPGLQSYRLVGGLHTLPLSALLLTVSASIHWGACRAPSQNGLWWHHRLQSLNLTVLLLVLFLTASASDWAAVAWGPAHSAPLRGTNASSCPWWAGQAVTGGLEPAEQLEAAISRVSCY